MERPKFDVHEGSSPDLNCCCGRVDCALLKKNCSILETVENDVHTAARLGQALLTRHEAYMADAERDRLDLTARIDRLEMAKQELEAENALKIEENRNLLDQLEALNKTVSESDTRIKSLEASLLSSEVAVQRLEAAAIRAADAERHLHVLELEQAQLHEELQSTKEDSRSHARRFNEAQRGILDMQDQLERMESEARKEQERHVEVIERMERQREIAKQLDTAAGRLKGAAATKSINEQKSGSAVVTHFVRDLLEDNANLQLGIAELREMLYNANDEIQSLREQLMFHQPMAEETSPAPTLKAELESPLETPRVSQELHVHHHYHVTPKPEQRKLRRKRPGLTSGTSTPPVLSSPSLSATGGQWRLTSSPTAPALLSLSSKQQASIMSTPRHSWSGASDQPSELASSLPSSPRTTQRDSMFDPTFLDSELPTSPGTSIDPMSPTWRTHQKRPSEISILSFKAPSVQIEPGTPPTPQAPRHRPCEENTIHEEDEDVENLPRLETPDLVSTTPSVDESSTIEGSEISRDEYIMRPRLHRAVSHESIMSLAGGLDIHTLKVRPSQLTLRPLGGVEAVVTGVTAQPTLSRSSAKRSAVALRDTFAGIPGARTVSSPIVKPSSPKPTDSPSNSGGGLGKWVGWRPWGGSASSGTPNNTPAKDIPKTPDKDQDKDWNRAPGINQPGSIPGFHKYWAAQRRKGAPAKVTTETIDHNALAEVLQESHY